MEEFDDDFDDPDLQRSALSLTRLLALDEDEDGGFEKLLGRFNDKDLEDLIDLEALEQLERDINVPDSPELEKPVAVAQKRKLSPDLSGKRRPTGKGKRAKEVEEEPVVKREPEKLYCICRQPQNNRFMICCDKCEEWYHGDCVGITVERGRQMERESEDYTCARCVTPPPVPTAPTPTASSRPPAHIPSSLREKAKSLKVATVLPTKHYSSAAESKYSNRSSWDTYDHVERSSSKCRIDGCTEYAMKTSNFCSEKCVLKFAQENMKGSDRVYKQEPKIEEDVGRYEEKKQNQPNPMRLSVRKHLKNFLSNRAKEATDLLVTEDEIVKIAQNIEMSLYKLFPDCGSRYKAKCKAICFNISDSKNINLYRNILSGTLSSEKLAKMSLEEMSVRVKAKQSAAAASSSASEMVNVMDMLGDTTALHGSHVFDVKCRRCTGKAPKKTPSKASTVSAAAAVAVPQQQQQPDQAEETLVGGDLIPNRLAISAKPLKDPLGLNPALWKGYITMTSLTKFATAGYHVFGRDESLLSVLPDTLHVQGRIANNIVWAYVDRLRNSPVKELVILKFESQPGEEVHGYSNLFHYLLTRSRCGVIGNVTAPVRDMYLVPVAADRAIPPQLRLLGVSSIAKKNRTNMILGLIVVNRTKPKQVEEEEEEEDQGGGGDDGGGGGGREEAPTSSSDLDHLATFPTNVAMPSNINFGEDDDDDDG